MDKTTVMELTQQPNIPLDRFARDIMESGMRIQAFGVSATLAAFGVFISANWGYFSGLKGLSALGNFVGFGCPVAAAYGMIIICLFLKEPEYPEKALRRIFWFFIFADTFFLGSLVWFTGGPSSSVFIPIFLLIPTIACCYCHPKSNFFKRLILGVIIVYLVTFSLEIGNIFLPFTSALNSHKEAQVQVAKNQAAQTATPSSSALSAANSPAKDFISMQNAVKACTGLLTTLAIITAAFSYRSTSNLRSKYCKEHRDNNSVVPNLCKHLLLQ
ncbi:MAG: hypothetical protein FVQ80_12130 [Planctomycetes bacterium]|nr:hypothetical protein [Planctomycetota bacterium]